MKLIAESLALLVLTSLSSSCTSSREPSRTADTAPAPGVQGALASDAIARARCAREARCDNIGVDRKFTTTDDCAAAITEDWREDLSARQCPAGVNEPQLNECLREVRFEDCSSPFDTLSRMAACTTNQICAG